VNRLTLILIAFPLLAAAALKVVAAEQETPAGRIEALLESMGGRAGWAGTHAMRIDATHYEAGLSSPYENRIVLSFELPRIRIEAESGSIERTRAIVGKAGWHVSEKSALRPMTPDQVESDLQWWNAHIYRTVHRLANRDAALEGEIAQDGRLLIKTANGSQLMWIRQNATGEPLQFGVGEAASGTVFGPLLPREGVRIPSFSVSPDGTWRAIIRQIEVNPDLSKVDFENP
jgi:hypothetical protein